MTETDIDQEHLARAIELAERGTGQVHPNPRVGAVVVKDDEILGEGWHAEYGGPHAEVNAIADCGDADTRGATMYVSLEPCCHQGKTPPCTDAIVAAGHRARRRRLGRPDREGRRPRPGDPARRRRRGRGRRRRARRPRAAAQPGLPQARPHRASLDPLQVRHDARRQGRHPRRRLEVDLLRVQPDRAHHWRASVDAVAVGIGTALADDPLLTARVDGVTRQPRRVVFDSTARLPLDSQLVTDAPEMPLTVVISRAAPRTRRRRPGDRRRRRRRRHGRERAGPRALRAGPARRARRHLDPARGRPAPGGRVLRRRRDRRDPAVHRAARPRRPVRARPAGGRGRRADLRGAAGAHAGLRAVAGDLLLRPG